MIPKIELVNVSKRFEAGVAISDISFSVQPGERVALIGPSGAGKSLILMLIAGIEKPTSGTVFIDGKPMNALRRFLSPSRRGIGLVTQDMALHPNRTALAYMRSGFRGKNISSRDRERYICQMSARLGVEGHEKKFPHQISGGERGRFALIRALAPGNKILLLDEPFSALDPHQREQMVRLIRDLHEEMALTTIYVTHYIEEAQSLCDSAILIRDGQLLQKGSWLDLKYRPATPYVRDFTSVSTRFRMIRSSPRHDKTEGSAA